MNNQSGVFINIIWAILQRFGTVSISFVSNVVLARFLTPNDFGTVGMLLFFIAIAETFVDGGFGSALIQRQDITQTDKSTIFYINLIISIFLYICLFICAPFIADFYKITLLTPLLRIQGLTLIIQSFGIVQSSMLNKEMKFMKLSVCNLLGALIGSTVGIILAYLEFGVWSLVFRTIVMLLIVVVFFWITGNWKPSFEFSIHSFKKLFSFSAYIFVSNLMLTISSNIQSLILGKLFKPSVLGNFTQARSTRNIVSQSLSTVVGQVLYPDFSKHQNDHKTLEKRLIQSSSILSFVTTPILLICISLAYYIFYFLFGEKWLNAVPYFQILCIGGIFLSLQEINSNVIKALGHSKTLFYCNAGKTAFLCILLIFSAKIMGVFGLLWSMVLYNILSFFLFLFLSTKYIKASFLKQLTNIFINISIALLCYSFALCLDLFLFTENNLIKKLITNFIFLFSYFVIAYKLKIPGLLYFINKFKFRVRSSPKSVQD